VRVNLLIQKIFSWSTLLPFTEPALRKYGGKAVGHQLSSLLRWRKSGRGNDLHVIVPDLSPF